MSDAATKSEPPPAPGGVAVWPMVVEDARSRGASPTFLADMAERDAAGRAKYGVPLAAPNGRRFIVDAYQEALDLAVYLRGHVHESPDDQEARRAYWQALHLAEHIHEMVKR